MSVAGLLLFSRLEILWRALCPFAPELNDLGAVLFGPVVEPSVHGARQHGVAAEKQTSFFNLTVNGRAAENDGRQ